jgi:hypothetical protein
MVSPLGWAKTKIGELLREQKKAQRVTIVLPGVCSICIDET